MSEPSGDVVEQGREPGGAGSRNSVRVVVLVILIAAVGLALSRSGLLSADAPIRKNGGPSPAGPTAPRAEGLVARYEDHLVTAGQDDVAAGARLPDGFPSDAALVPVVTGAGAGIVLGAHHGNLVRVAPKRTARWQPIGRADRVVAPAAAPGRALVLRSGDVVEVEVGAGAVVQPSPFPGFDAAAGWEPEGVVSALGTRPLLMSRISTDGPARELALAWPLRRVQAETEPAVQVLGTFGPLVGIAEDWVLTTSGTCPGPSCRVRIASVTRDAVLARDVAPPPGWVFGDPRSDGGSHGPLVPVSRPGDGAVGLARLVAGGDNALLVEGTTGVDLDAGFAVDLDGSVYFLTGASESEPARLRLWQPDQLGGAVDVRDGALPDGARLVCVCG
ncbi:MAG: hypothetical protein ACRDWY_07135 [Actinomycetes bacterium]